MEYLIGENVALYEPDDPESDGETGYVTGYDRETGCYTVEYFNTAYWKWSTILAYPWEITKV